MHTFLLKLKALPKAALRAALDICFPNREDARILFREPAEQFREILPGAPRIALPYARAVFSYKNPAAKALIWEIKYRGNTELAAKAAAILYEEIIDWISDESLFYNFRNPLLIAMPLSKERLKERGFNQCRLLAETISARSSSGELAFSPDALVKIRHTEKQTGQKREDRLRNLRGCFSVPDPSKILGRNIILVDDVITTGATVTETRRALLEAGAARVIVLGLAH